MPSSDQDDPGAQGADAGGAVPPGRRASTTSGPARASARPGAPGGVAGRRGGRPRRLSVTSPATPRVARRRPRADRPERSTERSDRCPGGARRGPPRGRRPAAAPATPAAFPDPGRGGDPVRPAAALGARPGPRPAPGGGRRSGPPPRYPVGAQAALERRRALEQGAGSWAGAPRRQPDGPRARYRRVPRPPWSRRRGLSRPPRPRHRRLPRAARHRRLPRVRDADTGGYPALRDPDPPGYRPRREADVTASGDRGGAVAPSRRRWPGGDGYGGDAYGDDTYGDDYDDYDDAELDGAAQAPGLPPGAGRARRPGGARPSWRAGSAGRGSRGRSTPPARPGETVLVEIPEGTSTAGIGDVPGRRRRDQRRHGVGLVHEAARRRHHQGRQLRDAARLVVRRGHRRPEGRAAAARGRGVVTVPQG